jgi:hypothetical protein
MHPTAGLLMARRQALTQLTSSMTSAMGAPRTLLVLVKAILALAVFSNVLLLCLLTMWAGMFSS